MANCLEQNSIMYGLVRVTETTEGRDDGRGGTGKEKFCCVKWAPEDGTTPQRTPELQVFVVGQGGGWACFYLRRSKFSRFSLEESVSGETQARGRLRERGRGEWEGHLQRATRLPLLSAFARKHFETQH